MYSEVYEEQYLYDLKADPYELKNLIGMKSHREVARVMRERLLRRMKEIGEPDAVIIPAPEVESGQRFVPEKEVYL